MKEAKRGGSGRSFVQHVTQRGNVSVSRARLFINVLDPLYWIASLLCWPVLSVKLQTNETYIVLKNVEKHRQVLWANVLFGYLAWYGINQADSTRIGELVSLLLAPALVTGSAWFAISFGGVQEKLLDAAIDLTKWMFMAFTISLVTMAIALFMIVPWPVAVVVGFIIFLVAFAAITYDNVDSLKIGLDDALRRHSLTMLYRLRKLDCIDTVHSDEELQKLINLLRPLGDDKQ